MSDHDHNDPDCLCANCIARLKEAVVAVVSKLAADLAEGESAT